MAKVIPFKGYRYNPARVNIQDVVAPPYDVITPDQRDFLHQRHPHNIAMLTNPREMVGDSPQNNQYIRAGKALVHWIDSGILRQDERPSVYVYEQLYRYSAEQPSIRRGFIALARLEEQDSKVILGHEQTLMSAKYDRLNLMKECKANLSPIFSLYSQSSKTIDAVLDEIAASPAEYDFVDDSEVRNKLWAVTDPSIIRRLTSEMSDQRLIIADGHHRYETALIYRHIRRNEGRRTSEDALHNYVMMMFVNIDSGVTIYPIHRIISDIPDFKPEIFRSRLSEYFEVVPAPFDCSNCEQTARNLLNRMAEEGETRHTYGLYLGGDRLELLKSKDDIRLRELVDKRHCESFRTLDVAIAQAAIFQEIMGIHTGTASKEEHVRYTPSEGKALDAVRRGEAQAALLLNPTKSEQVKAVTYEGEKMPQKSTYFYPKLLSGLVINRFDC
ncbi:MAG: DUF1015 domain-containing protein [Candidatus Abyssobacteria bacterium SURF_5]|uniref:DUF1015 domain-containing protein n=1 Tax=Abyssobacteria bacterium (strain SURF_5) TaxID=2093360 RepID=A0A3A4NIB2_ABYX5|nr:MAG: DUF1015 domain-containing protein [Candidatus Abyssubacteria bacterium SURF_5]